MWAYKTVTVASKMQQLEWYFVEVYIMLYHVLPLKRYKYWKIS